MSTIVNIAAYKFIPLEDLQAHRDRLRRICIDRSIRGTVLISSEGINLFLAGESDSIFEILSAVRAIPGLEDLAVKESLTDYQPFNRMVVKIKREIVPVGIDGIRPDPAATPKISPGVLKGWLDEKRPIALLDTRNQYEVSLGTFDGAIDLHLKTFREFPAAAASLPDEVKKQPVVMFCTGGIRCEKIGPYMKGLGFEQIYQLDGGILKYFEECEQSHYTGECFVFDQRVAVDPHLDPAGIAECFACKHSLDEIDLQSPHYEIAKSCPYCYRDPVELAVERLRCRQATIDRIAHQQRGCIPYVNKRWLAIPLHASGNTLVEALQIGFPRFGIERWRSAIEEGHLQVPSSQGSGLVTHRARADKIVRAGERFLHCIPNYSEPLVSAQIQLLYEDEAIVVVNKGAPLPVHPSGRFNLNTLTAILSEAYYPEKLRPAHRLDAQTTGLVVLARRYSYASKLQPQFTQGTVEKAYLAVVQGWPSWEEIECDLAISRESLPSGGRRLDRAGLPCLTLLRVLERRSDGTALIEAVPRTGRTHQIRLHLAALGHPILNESVYLGGGESRSAPDDERARLPLGLHAWKIEFEHPVTCQRVAFESDNRWMT